MFGVWNIPNAVKVVFSCFIIRLVFLYLDLSETSDFSSTNKRRNLIILALIALLKHNCEAWVCVVFRRLTTRTEFRRYLFCFFYVWTKCFCASIAVLFFLVLRPCSCGPSFWSVPRFWFQFSCFPNLSDSFQENWVAHDGHHHEHEHRNEAHHSVFSKTQKFLILFKLLSLFGTFRPPKGNNLLLKRVMTLI